MATPRNIGRYEIISEIGHGAMGVVYLAHDPSIDRRVAIKTIHPVDRLPAAEAAEVRQRFLREARAAGRLQHPGIVTIFDVGEHQGVQFLAMEYIEGRTLEAHTKRGDLLPANSAIELIAQACDALDYAHKHGIVHRDIKPANMMLPRDGHLKITDFGLAKNPHTNLTQEGILVGTPNYMSPEQVMGRPLDGRSDLFSLAAVLYELLTGERPFPGDTVTTIIYRILNEQPSPPNTFNKQIPGRVAQVLARALAKDPEARFQTGYDLACALQGQAVMVAAGGIGGSVGVMVPARPPMTRRPAPAEPAAPAARPAPRRPKARDAGADTQPVPRKIVAKAAPAVWPARVRSGFILTAALGLVVLLPGAGALTDRWGAGGSDGRQPFYRTAGIVGGGTGSGAAGPAEASMAPPVVTLPGGTETIGVTWRTSPAGGRIYVDDVEAPGGVVRLPKTDRASHTVVAENDCFIEKVAWRAGQDKDGATRTIELKTPKVAKLPVASNPSGARILLDGKDTGQVTPADVPVTQCGDHTVALRLEGYKDIDQKISRPDEPVSLELARIPAGFVKIAAPYPVTIFEHGKAIGTSGAAVKLSSGAHRLTLKNEDLFVEKTIQVNVPNGRTAAPAAGLPALGRLTVLASPSNCTIFVNGRDLGAPPINDLAIAAGTYSIRAVYVPTGQSKETSVTIAAGSGARVPFKFEPR